MPDFPSGALTGERDVLLAFLRFHRETILWKAEGLDAERLGTRSTPSQMTLAGMLKHCAMVERWWLGGVFAGGDVPEPFVSAPWDDDDDWDWHSAPADDPEQLRAWYREAIDASDDVIAGAALDDVASGRSGFAGQPTLRWVLLHVITETARHAGHADLIREALDGAVGWRAADDR